MTIPEWDRDRLRNLGLHEDLLEELAWCGPTVGMPIADHLAKSGGRDVIRQVNAAYRRFNLALAQARGTASGRPSSPDAEQP